ncbi:MAG: type 4b pilus protein PilO2, partial [Propionivibrio sp.]
RSFEEFIPKKNGKPDYKHAWWVLKPVKASVRTVFRSIAPFVLVGAALAGAYLGYQKWQRMKAHEAAMAAQALADRNRPMIPSNPWKDKPVATAAVISCAKSFKAINSMWPGNWKPESVVCGFDGGVTTVTWKRGERGWVQHLQEMEPRAIITGFGDAATLTVPLETGGGANEMLVEERARVSQILHAGERYGFNVTFAAAPTTPPLPGSQQNNQVQLPWREMTWAMRGGGLSPESVIRDFDGPGFRIRSITARFNDGLINWELEGSQYVLP